MKKVSNYSEEILREILNNRLENGNCDLSYWEKRFNSISGGEESLLRGAFGELIKIDAISVRWADDIPYFMTLLPVGVSYFDSLEEAKQTSHVNNFYGNVSNIQIQQGCQNSNQYQTIESINDERLEELIRTINQYQSVLPSEIGKANSEYLMTIIKELKTTDDNSKKKQLLSCVKDIFTNVTGGLVTTGILTLLQGVL